MRRSGAVALATVGLAGCIGTENGDDDGGGVPDTIVVGQPASVTGAWDFLQPAASAATDLAVQQINDAGGPLDSDFEVDRQELRDGSLIDEVGTEAEGAWIAAGSTQGPNYDQFRASYDELSDEELHPWGVAAYDATNVLALAIHHTDDASREAIQQSIGAVARPEGTTVTTFASESTSTMTPAGSGGPSLA